MHQDSPINSRRQCLIHRMRSHSRIRRRATNSACEITSECPTAVVDHRAKLRRISCGCPVSAPLCFPVAGAGLRARAAAPAAASRVPDRRPAPFARRCRQNRHPNCAVGGNAAGHTDGPAVINDVSVDDLDPVAVGAVAVPRCVTMRTLHAPSYGVRARCRRREATQIKANKLARARWLIINSSYLPVTPLPVRRRPVVIAPPLSIMGRH